MMRVARRASVVVVLLLLASVDAASAECAWIMWTAMTVPVLPPERWDVVEAYPTVQECEAGLAQEFARQHGRGWEVDYVDARTIRAFTGKGRIAVRRYLCLPETIKTTVRIILKLEA